MPDTEKNEDEFEDAIFEAASATGISLSKDLRRAMLGFAGWQVRFGGTRSLSDVELVENDDRRSGANMACFGSLLVDNLVGDESSRSTLQRKKLEVLESDFLLAKLLSSDSSELEGCCRNSVTIVFAGTI